MEIGASAGDIAAVTELFYNNGGEYHHLLSQGKPDYSYDKKFIGLDEYLRCL